MTKIRTGEAPASLTRARFQERFQLCFHDAAFSGERDAIARLEVIAWDALQEGRKVPITRPAGRPRIRRPDLRTVRAVAGHSPASQGGTEAVEQQRSAFARAAGLRQRMQRRHLSRRGIEDLAVDRSGPTRHRARGHAGRRVGPEPGHIGVRPQYSPVRGLCVERDKLDRYIGYYEPYYNSHDALDKDNAVQEETRNVARAVAQAVKELRARRLSQPDKQVKWPRTK